MTNEQFTGSSPTPFIFRFAERMPDRAAPLLRYDVRRQMAQVQVGNAWLDTPDARVVIEATTRMTKVSNETTDDQ